MDDRINLAKFVCVSCLLMTGIYFLLHGLGFSTTESCRSENNSTNESPPLSTAMFTPRSVHSTDRNAFGVPVTWETVKAGMGYEMNIGRYKQYVVATELMRDGKVVLRDYTPGGEYILFMDPKYENEMNLPTVCRAADGTWQLAFRHRSIYDKKLDAYFTYRVTDQGLELASYKP